MALTGWQRRRSSCRRASVLIRSRPGRRSVTEVTSAHPQASGINHAAIRTRPSGAFCACQPVGFSAKAGALLLRTCRHLHLQRGQQPLSAVSASLGPGRPGRPRDQLPPKDQARGASRRYRHSIPSTSAASRTSARRYLPCRHRQGRQSDQPGQSRQEYPSARLIHRNLTVEVACV